MGAYVGDSGPNIEFGDYKKMEGKGGADVLTSYASVFTKIYGDGGGDTLAYIGNDWAKIWGGKGSDWLLGGPNSDWLKGGKGNDHFGFVYAPDSKDNKDDIADFKPGKDMLVFATFIYDAVNYDGQLKKKHFEKGKGPDDGNDFFGYHKKKGTIWYDPNGDDPGGKEKVACVDKGLKLSYHDFQLDINL